MLTAPDVPSERVAALRAAFHAAISDPDFVAIAAKQRLELEENPGATVAQIIDDAYATPPDIVAEAKDAISDTQSGQ
jgi:tripartite-type tricarboxylate transporter receptor subunit TctC